MILKIIKKSLHILLFVTIIIISDVYKAIILE